MLDNLMTLDLEISAKIFKNVQDGYFPLFVTTGFLFKSGSVTFAPLWYLKFIQKILEQDIVHIIDTRRYLLVKADEDNTKKY